MTAGIVFAGGGSGGHISPGLAVAECLVAAGVETGRLSFLCSERSIDATMLAVSGFDHQALPARAPAHRPDRLLAFIRAFRASRRAAAAVLAERRAALLITMGGFVAAPVAAAARHLGVPILLVNLDAPPGRANRWIARRAQRVVSAIGTDDGSVFDRTVVGVPIRRAARADGDAAACRTALGLDARRPTLLVTGASQGARTLNELALDLALRAGDALDGWQVLHLAGRDGHERAAAAWRERTVAAVVLPFLDAMGQAWGAATLALSRAGANSVAEARANSVPAVFMPYPWHKDAHQARNAQLLVEAGAAVTVTDHVDREANRADAGRVLESLLRDPERVEAMRAASAAMPREDAAERIAGIALEMLRAP